MKVGNDITEQGPFGNPSSKKDRRIQSLPAVGKDGKPQPS